MQHSNHPSLSYSPSDLPSITPSISPSQMFYLGRMWHPCYPDQPLSNAQVQVITRQPIQTITTTDENGYYRFYGLSPDGSYYVVPVEVYQCRRLSDEYIETDPRDVSVSEDRGDKSTSDGGSQFEFFMNGDSCDTKISNMWNSHIEKEQDNILLFDTLDECCANMFWYDMEGCFDRSSIAFQFQFCVELSVVSHYSVCPQEEINIIESAMRLGLEGNVDLMIHKFGDFRVINEAGQLKCVYDPTSEDVMLQNLRGLSPHGNIYSTCGIATSRCNNCKDKSCLTEEFDKVSLSLRNFLESPGFLLHLYRNQLPSLQDVFVVDSSFTKMEPFLPTTVTPDNFHQSEESDFVNSLGEVRFYPTWIAGQLCNSKSSFENWEESYSTLAECCKAHFSWDQESCLNMSSKR